MKVISAGKLIKKNFKTRELSEPWSSIFGKVDKAFVMIIWGHSFAGKSSMLYSFMKELAITDTILYVNLEESFSTTSKEKAIENSLGEFAHKIRFANHETTYDALVAYLSQKRSPQIVIIDSLQYFNISYVDYKHLKEKFPRKSFIFISHAMGKNPDGKTAVKIRYDAGIKVFVEKFIAFVDCRYGGSKKHYVIWEDEAKRKWGRKEFNKITKG